MFKDMGMTVLKDIYRNKMEYVYNKLYAAKTVMIAREISSNMKAKAGMGWACKNHNIRNPY